jgi:hypothetical protein
MYGHIVAQGVFELQSLNYRTQNSFGFTTSSEKTRKDHLIQFDRS